MIPTYNVNMDALDFAALTALTFFAGFVTCIWFRYWVYRLDVRITVLYLRSWAVEYDWRLRLDRAGLVFPAWDGSNPL